MRVKLSSVVAAVVMIAGAGVPAGAQSPVGDTLPFRKGQWGVEFPLFKDYSITLLRFGSNSRALLVDGAVAISRSKSTGTFNRSNSREVNQQYTVRVGQRLYRALAFNTAGFLDVGVEPTLGFNSRQRESAPGFLSDGRSRNLSVGIFSTIGGNYFVTPRLSLGMSSTARLFYFTGKDRVVDRTPNATSIGETTIRGYGFSARTADITAAIYF